MIKKICVSLLLVVQALLLFAPIKIQASPPQNKSYTLPFKAKETLINSEGNTLYAIEENGTSLYALSLNDGGLKKVDLGVKIQTISFKNNKIYAALLISEGDGSTTNPEKGNITILDGISLSKIKSFEIAQYPYDMEVDSKGFIYVSGTSKSNDYIKSYSELTTMFVSSVFCYSKSLISLSKNEDILYSGYTYVSPKDIYKHSLLNGKFISSVDSPYHGDYEITENFFPSPDGKYVFFNSGVVLTGDSNGVYPLNYLTKIQTQLNSLTFNLEKNEFYAVDSNGLCNAYDYSTFRKLGYFNTKVDEVKFSNNQLYGITNSPSSTKITLLNSPDFTNNEEPKDKLYGDVVASIHLKSTNKAYILEKTFNRLYELDTNKNIVTKIINLPYRPSAMTVSEDEKTIYIANNHSYMTVTALNPTTSEMKHINFDMEKNCRDFAEKKIYVKNNLIYVVDGSWSPKLYVFDEKTLKNINYGTSLDEIGGMAFTKDGKYFFTYKQYGFDAGSMLTGISKYSIVGTTFNKVDEVIFDTSVISRDPLFTPLILRENDNTLIFKNHIINANDLKTYAKSFNEEIYALSNNGVIAAGKMGIYLMNRGISGYYDGVNSYNPMFFNNDGVLYLEKDNEIVLCAPISGDVNGDAYVDITDLALTSSSYNAKFDNENYKFIYDTNSDKIIDIYDLVFISRRLENTQKLSIEMDI